MTKREAKVWEEEQRKDYWAGRLTKRQIRLLKEAGFPFGKKEDYQQCEVQKDD